MAKEIRVSADSFTNSYLLPGGTGEMSRDGAVIDDTIFGQTFKSEQSGIIALSIAANALYKGFAGYVLDIKKQGSPTGFSTEACTLVSGKIYRIDDDTKEVWDRTVSMTVFDNAIDSTDEVESIDPLFGTVTFKASYSVNGPVTLTGSYMPMAVVGKARSITLTQTAEAIDTTDFPTAQANNGYKTVDPGLRTVAVSTDNVYALASGFAALLEGRTELILEINPDGSDLSRARGFFRCTSHNQSGDVGALEEETVDFSLTVPETALGAGPLNIPITSPFKWDHAAATTLSTAIQTILSAWENETKIGVDYLYDGTNGSRLTSAIVTDVSLSSGMEDMNEFTANFESDGAATAQP